jgi:hypothetical protein
MSNILTWCLVPVACLGCGQEPGHRKISPNALQNAERQVRILHDAMISGDYSTFAEKVYPRFVDSVGGREKFANRVGAGMQESKNAGIKESSFLIHAPREIHTGDENCFVIIPTTIEYSSPTETYLSNSFYLGISSDNGDTWQFVDGAYVDGIKPGILPKLPATVILPERSAKKVR